MPLPEWLPARTQKLIETAAARLEDGLGNHLDSVVLVGAAMHKEREDRARAPELIAIVDDIDTEAIDRLSRTLAPSFKDNLRIRILTKDEVHDSCDVFTLEAADWRLHHYAVRGEDPFAELEWTNDDMRRSLETNLRALNRRLRNRVLTGLAREARRAEVERAVIDAVDALAVAADHALRLAGREVLESEADRFAAFGTLIDADTTTLVNVVGNIRRRERIEVLPSLDALAAVIRRAVAWIDRFEVNA